MAETNTTVSNSNNNEGAGNSNDVFYGKNAVTGTNSPDGDSMGDISGISQVTGQQIQLDTSGGESSLSNGEENPDVKVDDGTPQGQQGETQPEEPPQTQNQGTAPLQKQMETNTQAITSVGKDLISKGVNLEQAINEFEESGQLSEATLKAIEKAGYPRDVVNGLIEARRALDAAYTQKVYDYVGGEKEYQSLANWMRGNLDKEAIAAFNEAVDAGNIAVVRMMLDGVKAQRIAKQGTRKPMILGGTTRGTPSNQGFANKQEMVTAMSDKRYGVDREYTLSVERKMMYSNIF